MTHPITCHARQAPDPDLILAALHEARQRRDQADADIRILLAYAREIVRPRPYRLCDLADAAGMSISGVRVAYTTQHINQARRLLPPSGAAAITTGNGSAGTRA